MLFIAQLSPLQTGLLPPFQPVTTAELWHLRCWGSKDRVGMGRFFLVHQAGFTVFFSMLSLLVHYYSSNLFKICRWCTMLQEKRENRRQTWSYQKETFVQYGHENKFGLPWTMLIAANSPSTFTTGIRYLDGLHPCPETPHFLATFSASEAFMVDRYEFLTLSWSQSSGSP